MPRYINSADALHTLNRLAYETALNQHDFYVADVFEDIAKNRLETWVDLIPTADVVEVVRCKDCKHRDPEDKKCDNGHFIQWQLQRDDDWFCADGERNENGEETDNGRFD